MNNFRPAYMKSFLFFLVLLCTQTVWAKTDTQYSELAGTALTANAPLSVSGLRYNGGTYIPLNTRTYWIEHAYGLVKLQVPVSTQTVLGTATVVVNVSYTVEENNSFVVKTQNNVTLSVAIGTENATDASYFLAPEAQNIQVQVVSVSNPNNLAGLTLSASAVTESFDYITFADVPAGLAHSTMLTAGGSLPVSWKHVPAAESYELEWTYISNQGATPTTILTFSQLTIPPFYFRNNSSRVEITDTSYQVPLVYEKGYILYRVRAVGKAIVNSAPVWVKSNWTYLDNGTSYLEANAYLYNGLENNLNWQSSLSFAEEGKNKVVVSYHDGSSRNRQAVTRINTDGRAVVGETMYDYNGRPVIQTLPVPVHKDSLGYYPNFNVVDNKTVLNKEDVLTVSPDACNPVGPALSDKTGASKYYSPSNDFKASLTNNFGDSIINKELIPDAKKYPYSQTVYTPDNTGRIATQSGFGETNRLGTGHETSYLYATPLQSELCRLFGSQVGYAAHYKKNTVIDPNGQVSVSYLDMDGKVVATALAGGAPDNVSSLGNNNTRTIDEDIIKTNPMSNELSADSASRTFNKKFVVTSNSIPYTFSYNGSFGYYDIPCKTNGTYMHIDGVVDVTVTLKDKCGAVVFSTTKSTVQGNNGTRQGVATGNIPATLSTGEYQISKRAEINEDKLAAYTQDYLASTCAKQLADFKAEEEAKINYADCNLTCASCKTEVNRLLALTYLTDEQREDIKNMCASICDESIGCSASLSAMKGDMSPGGQYAELRVNRIQTPQISNVQSNANGTLAFANLDNISINHDDTNEQDDAIQPQAFPLSIYNSSNRLPLGSYLSGLRSSITSSEYWRYPIKITKSGDVTHPKNYQILNDASNPITLSGSTQYSIGEYLDEKGDTAFIYVQKKITIVGTTNVASYVPEIVAGSESKLKLVDANLDLYKIPVRYLNKIEDFEKNWKSHWAYALLPYHPEFPYYIACIAQNTSNDFDYKLMNTSFADAKQQGFIQTDGTPAVFSKEGSGTVSAHVKPEAIYTTWMNANIANYQGQGVSMALLANRLTNCPNGTAETNACGAPAVDCNDTKIDTELEWSTYRSLYFSVKQKFLKNLDMIKAVDQSYYNGCIGHANYISSPEAWYFDTPKSQTVTATVRSCTRRYWFWSRCGWKDITYTAYIPSYLIQSQICFIGNAVYFKDKAQRFYPTGGLDNSVSQQTGNCPEVTYDSQNQPIVSLTTCADDLTALKNAADQEEQRLKYEMCGLCPLASDIESLLIQLTANNKLVTASTTISCSNDPIELGEALRRSVLGTDVTNPVLYWSSTASTDKKTITGAIRKGTLDVYSVTLAIADTFTTDHLVSVCCLTVKTANTFQLKATFRKGNKYKDVWLNGTINLDLKSCTIPPKCVLTEDAGNTANLLNILSANNHLTSSTGISLFDGINDTNGDGNANVDKYFDAVLSLLRITDASVTIPALTAMNPTWSATVTGNAISGTLTYTIGGVEKTLLIEVLPSGSPVTTTLTHPTGGTFPDRPRQFNSLSPVSYTSTCTSGCGTEFGTSILYSTGNQFYVQKAVISVPLLLPVKCTTVVPATISRQ